MIADRDIPGADPAAVVQQYERFLYKIAQRYNSILNSTGAVDLDDLIQVGRIAIVKAQQRYDPDQCSFIHYLSFYVRSAMRRELKIDNQTGEVPARLVYLDEPLSEESDNTLCDTIADPDILPFDDVIIGDETRKERSDAVHAAVDKLKNPKQREIINRVYFREQERKQAAAEMNVSYGVANSIEHQALAKLKRNNHLRQFVTCKRIGLYAFRYLWKSEEEDFIIRQERAYDLIYGTGAYVASFQRDNDSRVRKI